MPGAEPTREAPSAEELALLRAHIEGRRNIRDDHVERIALQLLDAYERLTAQPAAAEVTEQDRARAVEILCMTMDEDREAIAQLVAELRVLRSAHAQGAGALDRPLEWNRIDGDGLYTYVGPYACSLTGYWDDDDTYRFTEWRVCWGEASEDRPLTELRGECTAFVSGDALVRAAIAKHLSGAGLVPAPAVVEAHVQGDLNPEAAAALGRVLQEGYRKHVVPAPALVGDVQSAISEVIEELYAQMRVPGHDRAECQNGIAALGMLRLKLMKLRSTHATKPALDVVLGRLLDLIRKDPSRIDRVRIDLFDDASMNIMFGKGIEPKYEHTLIVEADLSTGSPDAALREAFPKEWP